MGKLKTVVAVFELPPKLGILQHVEYEPRRPYEGLLTAEGCRRGVCVKYKAVVVSEDGKRWKIKGLIRESMVSLGGCIRQQVADALWELAGRYEVGVWYDVKMEGFPYPSLRKVTCGIVVNGVRLDQPNCIDVDDCIETILRYYRYALEKMREPPQTEANPAEELLQKWPELQVFGVDWVRAWVPHARERLIEVAKVLRRYPWMMKVIKKGLLDDLNPYMVEVYVARDDSVTCLSLNQLRTFCTQNGAVRAVKLELEFSRYEVYEGKKWAVYRPKGLLTFTAVGKEYVKIL
jgi:hypothetical protein